MDNLKFDELMAELSKSVSLLEGGNLPLEKAMDEYKRGVEIIKILNERLKEAKQQMRTIEIDK